MDKERKEAVENALRDERGKFESNVTKHDFESRLDNYQSQEQFKFNFMSGPEADKSKLPEIDSNFGQGSKDNRYEKLLNDIDNYIGELSSEIEKEYMRTQSLNSDESSEIYKKNKQSKELMDSLNEFKQNFEEAANWIDREIYHSKDAGGPAINDPHSFDVNELTEEYLPKHEKAPELGDLESESEISFSDDGVEPISPSSSESKRTEAEVDSDNELDPFKTISENAGIELDEINNSVKRINENSESKTEIPNIFSKKGEPKTISEQASQVLDLAKNEADLQGLENFRDSLADLQLNINDKLKESPEARQGLEKELKPYFDKTKELAKNNGLEVAGDRVDKSKHGFIESEIDSAAIAKNGEKLESELEGSFHKKLSDVETVMEKHNPTEKDLKKIDKLSKKVGDNSERFNNQEIAKQNQRDIAKEVQESIGSIKGEVNTQVSKGLVNKELDNLDNKLDKDKDKKNEIGFAELKKANQVNTKDKLAEKVDAAREAANDKNSSLKKSHKQAIVKSLGKIEKAAGLNQGKGRGVS